MIKVSKVVTYFFSRSQESTSKAKIVVGSPMPPPTTVGNWVNATTSEAQWGRNLKNDYSGNVAKQEYSS